MPLSAAAAAAIEVFRELGWEGAKLDQVMDLPLGTPEQRRIAKAGLEKGEWGRFGQVGPQTYGWISWLDVDVELLALFAVRQGVSARRAARLLTRRIPVELRAALLVERGPAFVSAYLEDGDADLTASIIAVAQTTEPVPTQRDYLQWWLSQAGETERDDIHAEVLAYRYADHVRAALRSGAVAPRNWHEAPRRSGHQIDHAWRRCGLDHHRRGLRAGAICNGSSPASHRPDHLGHCADG